MRKYVSLAVVLFIAVICLPSTALAVNSGAHIFIAEKVFGSDDIDLLYGSIAPDLSLYVPNPSMWPTGFDDTHYEYASLHPQGWGEPWKRFLVGWEIHNEEWGADWYSHIEYNGGSGYVVVKAQLMADNVILPAMPSLPPYLAEMIAHYAIEFAVDVLIQATHDPDLGQNLLDVAMYRSDEDIRRLFNILVAKNKVTDKATLYQSEMVFRGLISMYAQALAASNIDSPAGLDPLALFGSALAPDVFGVDIPMETVKNLLWAAIELCVDDYANFIAGIIGGIKGELSID